MLQDSAAVDLARMSGVSAADFESPLLAKLFAIALTTRVADGTPFEDVVRQVSEDLVQLAFELADEISPNASLEFWLREIRLGALDRQLAHHCRELSISPDRGASLVPLISEISRARIALEAGERASRTILVRLSEVQPERVAWLWEGRIPLGKLTLLDGDPGLGKSTLMLDIAARVSTGREMPDGSPGADGGVVLMADEDGLGDTIAPRLLAAAADATRVVAIRGIQCGGYEKLATLADVESIRDATKQCEAKLVVVDPLMAYLPGAVDSYKDQDVRRVLTPLAKLAEETGAAIVVIRHLNKVRGSRAIYRGGGSIGITGAARSALLVAPQDSTSLMQAPVPLGRPDAAPAQSFAFRFVNATEGSSRIEWIGPVAMSADHLVAAADAAGDPESRNAAAEARNFLRAFLGNGAKPAVECQRAAKAAGISETTLTRARAGLVKAEKSAFRGAWTWRLIEDRQEPQDGQQNAGDILRGKWLPSAATEKRASAIDRLRALGVREIFLDHTGNLRTDPPPSELSEDAFRLLQTERVAIRDALQSEVRQ
jgi:hypothetical protein